MIPVHAGRIVSGDAEAVLKRRIGILDVGIDDLVLMTQRSHIEPVKMDVGEVAVMVPPLHGLSAVAPAEAADISLMAAIAGFFAGGGAGRRSNGWSDSVAAGRRD